MGEREMSQNKSLQSKMPLAMGLRSSHLPHSSEADSHQERRSISTLSTTVSGV